MVSIVIATYNSSLVLRRSLDSVLGQDFQDWECIIIDGLSKDDTVKIILEYERKDKRFRHISESDKGIYDAFNKGLNLAKGEWILYLGSDDMLTKHGLSELMNVPVDDVDSLYCDIELLFPDCSTLLRKPYPLRLIKYVMIASHQAFVMRTTIVRELGGFELQYKMASDYNLIQKCYLANCKFKYVPVILSTFSYSGMSSQFSLTNDLDVYKINRANRSNYFPFFFFCICELKRYLGYLYKRFIKRCL